MARVMPDNPNAAAGPTAVRVALWRAMHVKVDAPRGAGGPCKRDPFISFFTPTEMLKLARDAGFQEAQHVSASTLTQRYFSDRTDGLRPPDNSEELLVAAT